MSFPDLPLSAIHAGFADPITYTGAGLALDPITAVYSNEAAEPFAGKGKSARLVTFEVQYEDLPRRPAKADRIQHSTGLWRPIEIVDRDDVGAWEIVVERAS